MAREEKKKDISLKEVDESGEEMVPEMKEEKDLKRMEDERRKSQRR